MKSDTGGEEKVWRWIELEVDRDGGGQRWRWIEEVEDTGGD